MTPEEAIKAIEEAQGILTPVMDEAHEITSDEDFYQAMVDIINLLEKHKEDLGEGLDNV